MRLELATGRLKLYGWVYNIENGTIDTFDADRGQFVPLINGMIAGALPAADPQRNLGAGHDD